MPSKITLYEHKDAGGRKLELTSDTPNLVNLGFNDIVSTVVVDEGVWILYEHTNYGGEIYVVMQGENVDLVAMGWNDKCSSLKPLSHDFTEEPICTIYQHSGFHGNSLKLTADAKNLKWYNFNDEVSSIKVQSGAWIAYEHVDYRGKQSLFLRGDYNMSAYAGGFRNDSISSMRGIQIKPSGPIELVKIDFDLSAGILKTTPEIVFKWTQRNDTDVEQSLSISQDKTVTKDNTYEFRWDQGTSVTASMEVSIGIPEIGLGSKMSIGTTSSYSVGSTSGKKVSKSEKWTINFPSKIPPRSSILLSSTITKGKMDVPFTAVLRQGSHTWTERGKFYGVNYFNFSTSFEEQKL